MISWCSTWRWWQWFCLSVELPGLYPWSSLNNSSLLTMCVSHFMFVCSLRGHSVVCQTNVVAIQDAILFFGVHSSDIHSKSSAHLIRCARLNAYLYWELRVLLSDIVAIWMWQNDFSSSISPDQLWDPPSIPSSGYRGPFAGTKRGRGVTLTTLPHLLLRSWMSRSYTPSPPCASMACNETALLLINIC
jgi:hypothetical protein